MQKIQKALYRIGSFILRNLQYILWFAFYFSVSYWLFSKNKILSKTWDIIILLVLYAVSIAIALLFGERILKFINGVRPVETKQEKEYIFPLFQEVYRSAKEVNPKLPKMKPYIIDTMAINACAIGSHTIAITKGAIDTFSEEELQGIILHEIAHIRNGDTKADLINKVGNGFVTVFMLFFNLFFQTLDFLFMDLDDEDTKHFSGLIRTFFFLLRQCINMTLYVLLFIGNIILSGNIRKNELRADKFAFKMGYGEGLKNALYLIQKLTLSDNMSLTEKMTRLHPRTSKRIAQLERLLDKEQRA